MKEFIHDIRTSVKNVEKYVQLIIKPQEEKQANSFPRDIMQDPMEESEGIIQRSSYSSELENFPPSDMEEEEDAQTKEDDTQIKEEAMHTPSVHIPIIPEEAIQVPIILCMQAPEKKNLNAMPTFELMSSPPTLKYAFLGPNEAESDIEGEFIEPPIQEVLDEGYTLTITQHPNFEIKEVKATKESTEEKTVTKK